MIRVMKRTVTGAAVAASALALGACTSTDEPPPAAPETTAATTIPGQTGTYLVKAIGEASRI